MTFSFLYRPREWPKLAENLAAALQGDGVLPPPSRLLLVSILPSFSWTRARIPLRTL